MSIPYGYIYLVRNQVNGKVYVGQTMQSVESRWKQHVYYATQKRGKTHCATAIRKYGPDAFIVTELGRAFSQTELDEMERRAIWSHSSTDRRFGYNIRGGGDSIGNHSDETRAKMSSALRGRRFSDATRAKMSESAKLRKRSSEEIMKFASCMRGKQQAPEHTAAAAEARRGLKRSEATRAKLVAAHARRRRQKHSELHIYPEIH